MAINPECDRCGAELTDYGALLFSPPDKASKAKKFHLCKTCFQKIVSEFEAKKKA